MSFIKIQNTDLFLANQSQGGDLANNWQIVTDVITDTAVYDLTTTVNPKYRYYLTDITVTNADKNVGTWVEVYSTDGAMSSTLIYKAYAEHSGQGFTHTFKSPVKAKLGEKLVCKCVTNSAEVVVSASGLYIREY